jgi:hypothetical protein
MNLYSSHENIVSSMENMITVSLEEKSSIPYRNFVILMEIFENEHKKRQKKKPKKR